MLSPVPGAVPRRDSRHRERPRVEIWVSAAPGSEGCGQGRSLLRGWPDPQSGWSFGSCSGENARSSLMTVTAEPVRAARSSFSNGFGQGAPAGPPFSAPREARSTAAASRVWVRDTSTALYLSCERKEEPGAWGRGLPSTDLHCARLIRGTDASDASSSNIYWKR